MNLGELRWGNAFRPCYAMKMISFLSVTFDVSNSSSKGSDGIHLLNMGCSEFFNFTCILCTNILFIYFLPISIFKLTPILATILGA